MTTHEQRQQNATKQREEAQARNAARKSDSTERMRRAKVALARAGVRKRNTELGGSSHSQRAAGKTHAWTEESPRR